MLCNPSEGFCVRGRKRNISEGTWRWSHGLLLLLTGATQQVWRFCVCKAESLENKQFISFLYTPIHPKRETLSESLYPAPDPDPPHNDTSEGEATQNQSHPPLFINPFGWCVGALFMFSLFPPFRISLSSRFIHEELKCSRSETNDNGGTEWNHSHSLLHISSGFPTQKIEAFPAGKLLQLWPSTDWSKNKVRVLEISETRRKTQS